MIGLVIMGLIAGLAPFRGHAQSTQGTNAPGTLLFHGYAFDIHGNPLPQGTPVYATYANNPEVSIPGAVIDNHGYYEIWGIPNNLGQWYYLSYKPHSTEGTGPVQAPAEVNIFPSQW